MNKSELKSLMEKLENTYFSEEEVIWYFVDMYGKDMDNIDLLNDINELFYERGYNCSFLMPMQKHKKFDVDEYCSMSKAIANSKEKTMNFITYLKEVNDHRVTNVSLHLIKVSNLVELGMLNKSNSYIEKCVLDKLDLRETLFQSYLSEDVNVKAAIKDIKENVLTKIGGYGDDYNKFTYYEFVIDTEYVLYSLGNYKNSNMIKLMFLMANEEHFKRGKGQYSSSYQNAGAYLAKINKEWYITKHKNEIDLYEHDGYVQFYRHLEVK